MRPMADPLLTRLHAAARRAQDDAKEAAASGAMYARLRHLNGLRKRTAEAVVDHAVAVGPDAALVVDGAGPLSRVVPVGPSLYRLDRVGDAPPAPRPEPPPLRLAAPRPDRDVEPNPAPELANATFVATAADVCELRPSRPAVVNWGCA